MERILTLCTLREAPRNLAEEEEGSPYDNASYTATYIKNISFCRPHIEAVFVKLSKDSLLGDKEMAIGCIYRPPQGDIDKFNDEIIEICEYFKLL